MVGTDPVQDVIAAGILVISYFGYRNGQIGRTNAKKLDEVHGLVNQQLTDAVNRRDVSEAENVELRASQPPPLKPAD